MSADTIDSLFIVVCFVMGGLFFFVMGALVLSYTGAPEIEGRDSPDNQEHQ